MESMESMESMEGGRCIFLFSVLSMVKKFFLSLLRSAWERIWTALRSFVDAERPKDVSTQSVGTIRKYSFKHGLLPSLVKEGLGVVSSK